MRCVVDRAEVSRRLKAGRWLAGGVDANGKPKELAPKQLADHRLLRANRITENRIREIEQLVTTARPVELAAIAEALRLPADWFTRVRAVSLRAEDPAELLEDELADDDPPSAERADGT